MKKILYIIVVIAAIAGAYYLWQKKKKSPKKPKFKGKPTAYNTGVTGGIKPPHQSGGGKIIYIIKTGDTLGKIAKKFGVTINQILEANPYIKNPDLIYAGKTLVIPQ